jgi:hypothetical protein
MLFVIAGNASGDKEKTMTIEDIANLVVYVIPKTRGKYKKKSIEQ